LEEGLEELGVAVAHVLAAAWELDLAERVSVQVVSAFQSHMRGIW